MWKYLKNIRVVFSLFFFILLCFIFLDITNSIPPAIINFIISFQIIPAITKNFFVVGISTVSFLFVLLVTISFGRVYCSTICPLGTFQDFIIRIARRKKKRRWFKYKRSNFILHYGFLTILTVSFLSGSTLLLNIVEPFSNFGRMANTLGKPMVIALNNFAVFALEKFEVIWLFAVQYHPVTFSAIGFVLLFTFSITYLSYYHGRLFCNLLCPAGALLGLVSRFSIFKIVINEKGCTHCKLCEKVCKANCINSETQRVDFAACVGCFNCMDACHTDGVIYKFSWNKNSTVQTTDESRRKFLKTITLPAVSTVIPFIDNTASNIKRISGFTESRKHPIAPPGSKSVEHFSSLCTACQLCVSSCPTKVLQPAFLDYGIAGILQPKMDYDASYCNYDCKICSDVCPSGAILPIILEEKKLTQLGKAKFYKDDCIVTTKKKDCGACSEHCPTKAVNMILHDGVFLPEVNEKICIGCGACEHACPTKPRKAIYVESNAIHGRAEKPKPQKPKEKIEKFEEFPF